jgi:alpha-D-xyloside xylohydrolase
VLSVQTTHWAGALNPGPHFDLYPAGKPESAHGKISKSSKGTTISSGALSATVHPDQHTFDIRFHATDGSKELTSLLNRSVGLAYSPASSSPMQTADMRNLKHYIFTQTTLGMLES